MLSEPEARFVADLAPEWLAWLDGINPLNLAAYPDEVRG